MLKIICTENGMYIEQIAGTIAAYLEWRRIFAQGCGTPLTVEPGWVALLLADLPGVAEFAHQAGIALCCVDAGFIEVVLAGWWLASKNDAEEGVFVVELASDCEQRLLSLWDHSRERQYSLSD